MSELLQAKELDAHEAAHHQLTIAPGIPKEGETYFHYKGGLYQVMAVGLKEDTLEPMIAYQSFVSGYMISGHWQTGKRQLSAKGRNTLDLRSTTISNIMAE